MESATTTAVDTLRERALSGVNRDTAAPSLPATTRTNRHMSIWQIDGERLGQGATRRSPECGQHLSCAKKSMKRLPALPRNSDVLLERSDPILPSARCGVICDSPRG